MKKRISAILLGVLIVVSILPMTVFAREDTLKMAIEKVDVDASILGGDIAIILDDKDSNARMIIGVDANCWPLESGKKYSLGDDEIIPDFSFMIDREDDTKMISFSACEFTLTLEGGAIISIDATVTLKTGEVYRITHPALAHTHGTGTDAITFEKEIKTFADLQDLFTNGGSGYLAEDITLTETGNLTVKEDVDLCLNDKTLDLNKKGNISVNGAKKFNLYDCGTTTRKWDVDATGVWVPAAPESTTTNTTIGGVITGGSAEDGGCVHILGPFTMNGGNIVGNTATNGGGIYIMSSGSAMMIRGNIVGNTASNGGGIWMDSYDKMIMLGGTVICNTASEQGGGIYYAGSACIAKGTMITLADGTRKPVEKLDNGDDIRVFDHDTGTLSHAKISDYWHYGEPKSGAFTLHFSNGIDVTAVTAHSFYEKAENRYVSLNAENAKNYVGHFFYNADMNRWETLESVTFLKESVETYLVATEKHLDCIVEGMLSCEDDIYTVFRNVFAFDKNMKVDEAQKAADIAAADGLWSYEDCPLFTKESFDALNLQYAKVAVDKGMISFKDIEQTAVYCSIIDTGHFVTDDAKAPLTSGVRSMLKAAPAKNPSITDFEGSSLIFGGNAQVKGNFLKKNGKKTANNIYLTSERVITLATGAYAPGDDMLLYVSIEADGDRVPITGAAGTDDVKHFKSDDPAYAPAYDNDNNLIDLERIPPVAYNCTQKKEYSTLAGAISESVSGDEIELWADENAESVDLPDGVTLYAKSGYTGTVTTAVSGKAVAKQNMFGEYQYKYFVVNVLTITYKDQGNKAFSGTHESGYPTTFMAEVPTALKTAIKGGYTFDGWYDDSDCTGDPITGFYAYTYTDDLTLYAKWICDHTNTRTKVDGRAATESAAGWKDYYKCDCGKLFEDADGKVEITDLAKWKAQGGNGYIAKLEEDPGSPVTGDNSNISLWIILASVSFLAVLSLTVTENKKIVR